MDYENIKITQHALRVLEPLRVLKLTLNGRRLNEGWRYYHWPVYTQIQIKVHFKQIVVFSRNISISFPFHFAPSENSLKLILMWLPEKWWRLIAAEIQASFWIAWEFSTKTTQSAIRTMSSSPHWCRTAWGLGSVHLLPYLQHCFPSPSLTQNCMRAGVRALVTISTGLFYLSLTNIELHEGRGEERQGQLMHEEGLVDLDGLGLHHGLHDEDHLHHLGQQVGVADVVLGAHHHDQQLQDGPRARVCQNIRHVTVNKREKNLTNGKGQAVLSARTSGM